MTRVILKLGGTFKLCKAQLQQPSYDVWKYNTMPFYLRSYFHYNYRTVFIFYMFCFDAIFTSIKHALHSAILNQSNWIMYSEKDDYRYRYSKDTREKRVNCVYFCLFVHLHTYSPPQCMKMYKIYYIPI